MKRIRTAVTWAALALAVTPALQGCFPLVAGGIGAGAMM
ncbi:MAG: transporter, partial [Zoogloea sp.]|nr:transporter [Zoogloea sp.]